MYQLLNTELVGYLEANAQHSLQYVNSRSVLLREITAVNCENYTEGANNCVGKI